MATTPTLSYSSRDFDTIKQSVVAYIQTNYPTTWNDFLTSNAGMALVDSICYTYSIMSWNLDKQANEIFLNTASFMDSVLRIADLLGYKPNGLVASEVLADAVITQALTGVDPLVIPAGTSLTTNQGIPFELLSDISILPGNTYPVSAVASQANTTPVNSTVNFIAGSPNISFYGSGNRTHNLSVQAGMWIKSSTGDTNWYRISSVSSDYTTITLDRPWNADFVNPFVIKTLNNDSTSSTTIVSSSPYGTFNSPATAQINSPVVLFSLPLPSNVQPNQWFRFNASVNCNQNGFLKIQSISSDRMSLTLYSNYGPSVAGGFDAVNSNFNIENHSITVVQGTTRTESFLSDGSTFQSFQLSSTGIIANSIRVTDESGITGVNNQPWVWGQVNNMALATGPSYISYELFLNDKNNYTIMFGNGVLGLIPTGLITITYRVGGGVMGNVDKGSINTSVRGNQGSTSLLVSISNAFTSGAGGSDGETIDELKVNIPQYNATNLRAVTGTDYTSLILTQYPKWPDAVGDVVKANINTIFNQIYYGGNFIYINCWERQSFIPAYSSTGTPYQRLSPVDSTIQSAVQRFISQYNMVTDVPVIMSGGVDSATLDLDVQIQDITNKTAMLLSIENALVTLMNSDNVLNGNPLLISDVYGTLEALPGVLQLKVRKMYLELVGTTTPASLQVVNDLYPRSFNSIVVPDGINLVVWSSSLPLNIYISASLSPSTQLAIESLRNALNQFFSNLRPGIAVNASDLITLMQGVTTDGFNPAIIPGTPVTLKFDSPVGATPTTKIAVPDSLYYLKYLEVKNLS